MGNARMYEALNNYGNRLNMVGIFTFEVDVTGTITETGTAVSSLTQYRNKWSHIKWYLTIMNHGTASIFTALRNNTNGAQDKFISEISRIIDKYQWCAGVDIDLERGGGYENKDAANSLFSRIYSGVKSKSKLMNICLPGMTGVNESVGGENWCVYSDLNNFCDTAAIMSYGMSWAGSAPGPVSPRDWLEGIYNYAVTAINPKKILFGLPAFGWNWRIHDTPENMGRVYRGTSQTYYAALNWMRGVYKVADDEVEQAYIPIACYWDDVNKVPWGLPQVYDFFEGQDANSSNDLIAETYKGRRYLTSYEKVQKVEFGTVFIDRKGVPDNTTGSVEVAGDMTYLLNSTSSAEYNFNINESGYYDVVVKLNFPFWNKNSMDIYLDSDKATVAENRLWWPYWFTKFYRILFKNTYLSEGNHKITITGGVPGVEFYGFKVCSNFEERPSAGEASYILSPQKFKDVNDNMVEPFNGFKITFEVLRRKPDSSLIFYEDFRDYTSLPTDYYEILEGSWKIWRSNSVSPRPYSQLEGYGKVSFKYDFADVHIRARLAFVEGGRAGVFIDNIFCCLNYDTQKVELFEGDNLLGSYNSSFSLTPASQLRTNPNMYTVEMRKRGNSIRVYSGRSSILRFQRNVSSSGGRVGIRAVSQIKCELLRLGDSWYYEPCECFNALLPGGSEVSFGRINRSNVSWNNEFNVFRVTEDIEEIETRDEDISLDYEFYHTETLNITCGNNYTLKINPVDINIWISRIFLGDANGFSILYYQDVDSLVYWANEAAYRWKLKGIAIWSLGQEDLRFWESVPKQIGG